jgi:hypothetical protein
MNLAADYARILGAMWPLIYLVAALLLIPLIGLEQRRRERRQRQRKGKP